MVGRRTRRGLSTGLAVAAAAAGWAHAGRAAGFVPGGPEEFVQGFADRVSNLGDPDFVDVPLERMLSLAEHKRRAAAIDLQRRSDVLLEPSPADTTSLVTADSEGRVVAYIHSLYAGSGVVVPGTVRIGDRVRKGE